MAPNAGLKRLANLYQQVEQMRLADLQRASARVSELVQAIQTQRSTCQAQITAGRQALVAGDRLDWTVAEMGRSNAERRMRWLDDHRASANEARDTAQTTHKASRLQSEQVGRVIERLRQVQLEEDGRRAQADMDDRFAARAAWTMAKQRRASPARTS